MICFVDDALPGITRRRFGKAWGYFDPHGERITDREEIDRLNAVGLPPAYKDAWFCPSCNGPYPGDRDRRQGPQAISLPPRFPRAAGSAQIRPLRRFRAGAAADPRACGKRSRRRQAGHDRVVAAIVRLLDLGHIRVGNEAYAQANESFGATTLRNRHAQVRGAKVKLCYMGKSGKEQRLTIEDKRLARLVRRCQDLPGQQLFQYLDGERQRASDRLGRRQRLPARGLRRAISPPSISAPGVRARSLSRRCSTPARRASRSSRCLHPLPRRWATRPRSAASPMSIPR